MKSYGLRNAGCEMRSDGWYKDGKFLGRTVSVARDKLTETKSKKKKKKEATKCQIDQ